MMSSLQCAALRFGDAPDIGKSQTFYAEARRSELRKYGGAPVHRAHRSSSVLSLAALAPQQGAAQIQTCRRPRRAKRQICVLLRALFLSAFLLPRTRHAGRKCEILHKTRDCKVQTLLHFKASTTWRRPRRLGAAAWRSQAQAQIARRTTCPLDADLSHRRRRGKSKSRNGCAACSSHTR